MRLTHEEIKERIVKRFDPDMLLEILEIDIEDLVDRLDDFIENRHEILQEYFTENAP